MPFIDEFRDQVHPAVLRDIEAFAEDAALARLHARLAGHVERVTFLDTLAEALVARHLRRRGCGLRFEVPTPAGKACDFEVTAPQLTFYLHVKRVRTEKPPRTQLTISSRLRALERIRRPYVVSVRWYEGTTDRQMQRLVQSATDFVTHARIGDELVVHDEDGSEIGGLLVVAPTEGPFVSVVVGLPGGFDDEAPRIRKLVRRAYPQFMPRATNLIIVCSSHDDDTDDFERAFLGSHVERWDRLPPSGQRVAHGRAADGVWHRRRYEASRIAGWFRLAPEEDGLSVRLIEREDPPPPEPVRRAIAALFRDDPAARPR